MSKYEWLKIDTAAIMFSSLSTKQWGRTFAYSAHMKSDVRKDLLEKACINVKDRFPSVFAYVEKGFFWNYLALTDALPEIREEDARGMLPITYTRDGKPDFRITYKDNRINLECSHSLGDGKGIFVFFNALLEEYACLCDNAESQKEPVGVAKMRIHNSYEEYYDKGEKAKNDLPKAFSLSDEFTDNKLSLLFAEMNSSEIKKLAHKYGLTVTEYLTAVLIFAVIKSTEKSITQPVSIAVPVNLRRFFQSKSLRNFTIQSAVSYFPEQKTDITLSDVISGTKGQLKAQLRNSELVKTVNKYGALVNNPVIRIVPNVIKTPVMKTMQKKTHEAYTSIFTNYGVCSLSENAARHTEKIRFINGDTREYGLGVTVSCISYGDTLSLCFSYAFENTVWFEKCMEILKEQGVQVSVERLDGVNAAEEKHIEKVKPKLSVQRIKAYFNTKI